MDANKLDNIGIWDATPENIWKFKQNHPEQVIEDLQTYAPDMDEGLLNEIKKLVRQSMLCRGINKWLKVRRDLISYKKILKKQIVSLESSIPKLKEEMTKAYVYKHQVTSGEKTIDEFQNYFHKRIEYEKTKAILAEVKLIRKNLKALCMTERWQLWQGRALQDMNTIKCSD